MKKEASCYYGKPVEYAPMLRMPHVNIFCPDLPPNSHLPQRTLGNISNNFSAISPSLLSSPPLHTRPTSKCLTPPHPPPQPRRARRPTP